MTRPACALRRPLRVVHVVRQFSPSVGGIEDVVLNLCRELREIGHDPRIVTLDRSFQETGRRLSRDDRVDDLPVTRIPFTGSRRYPVAPAVLRKIRGADIVHVHAIDFFFDYLALTKPIHRKPLLASTHGGFFHTSLSARLKQIYFRSVTLLASRAYDKICASSEADADLFRRIAPDRVTVIENGVDILKYHGRGAPEKRRTLLYFGRLSANKRVETVFPILRRLRDANPDWRAVIAGRPSDLGFEDLQPAAAASNVAEAVTFVENPSTERIADLMREASYFIAPSAYEGFGITAVEAISAGLVPILSDIPPFSRLRTVAGAGLLIDPLDEEAAAARVLALDRALGAEYASTRQRLIEASHLYRWPKVAERFIEEYRRAASSAKMLAANGHSK
jgi:alpha-1,3-mannosyltransferase